MFNYLFVGFRLANTEEVIQRIKEAGFKIQFEKEVTLTKDVASQFYQEHEGKDFFEGLTDHMARCVYVKYLSSPDCLYEGSAYFLVGIIFNWGRVYYHNLQRIFRALK